MRRSQVHSETGVRRNERLKRAMGLVLLALLLLFVCLAIVLLVRYMAGVKGKPVKAVAIVLATASVLFLAWSWTISYHHEHWAVCHVTGKVQIGQDGSYRIRTSDCNTLTNEDSYLRAKFDAPYIWAQIEPGDVYRFRIVGSYLPMVKHYANIMQVLPSGN